MRFASTLFYTYVLNGGNMKKDTHNTARKAYQESIDNQILFEIPFGNIGCHLDSNQKHGIPETGRNGISPLGLVIESNIRIHKDPNTSEQTQVGDRLVLYSDNIQSFIGLIHLMEMTLRLEWDEALQTRMDDDPTHRYDYLKMQAMSQFTEDKVGFPDWPAKND